MATGFYLSWTDKAAKAADTTDTIDDLTMAAAVASNLQRLQGYTRIDIVRVDDEAVLASITAEGMTGPAVDLRYERGVNPDYR